tara:strand:+ start:273 stop:1778 length:1506 start_codon:yes stop_codon:yes gene_type:complete
MGIIKPLKEWEEYIKFTDKYINCYSVNEYTISNFFLHPTRPIIQTNRILVNLKNNSLLYNFKLRTKFYISLLKTLLNIFKYNNEKKILENKKEIYKKNYDVIFVTHLINEKQFESSVDNYFGGLINNASKKGLSVLLIFIPHIKSNKKEFIKYLKKEKGYDSFLLDESITSFKVKYKTLISLLRQRQKFLKLSRNISGYSSRLALYTAESFLNRNNFCNFIYGLQIGDIINNTKSKNIVTTFEGHNWERLFYFFSRKNNPSINCVGFQHSIIFKYQHSLTRLLRKEWNPDFILSSGDTSTSFFLERISKEISIKTLGSPKSNTSKNKKINTNNRILFVPSGDEKEAYFFAKFAFNFAKKYPELKILIRFHPIINSKKFIKRFPKIENFSISKSKIEYDSKQSRYVIYSTSTAVLESISLGCIPIRLNWNSVNDLSDPLWQLKSELLKTIDSHYDLIEIIYQNKYSDNNEYKLNKIYLKLNQDLEHLRFKLKKSVFYNILKK